MRPDTESLELIGRRHPEWREHQLRWRWLLDSLEGGERYRQAVYGYDQRGLPVRNLVRHKREYPDPLEEGNPLDGDFRVTPGADPATTATDDDYELRRARTPVPTFVAEAIDTHLSRIYAREVRREGPDRLMRWWADVDGCGTSIDQWMAEAVAPLLLTLGQLDLCFDHPAPPRGRGGRDPRRCRAAGPGPLPRLVHPAREHALVAARPDRPPLRGMPRPRVARVRRRCRGPLPALDRGRVEPLRRRRRADLLDAEPVRPGPDHPGLRPPQAPVQEHRPAPIRGGRRAPARVLQPRLGADPLRHHPGPPPAARARGLRPGRRDHPDRPELAAAQEEERRRGGGDLRGVRSRPVPQGRRRVDPQEQGRPPRRRRPRLGPGPPGRPRRRGAIGRRQGNRPLRRQQPPGQDRPDPRPRRGADRRDRPEGPRRRPARGRRAVRSPDRLPDRVRPVHDS